MRRQPLIHVESLAPHTDECQTCGESTFLKRITFASKGSGNSYSFVMCRYCFHEMKRQFGETRNYKRPS